MNKIKENKNLSKDETLKKIRELKKTLKDVRFQTNAELLNKTSKSKQTRKEIARLNTQLCKNSKKIVK